MLKKITDLLVLLFFLCCIVSIPSIAIASSPSDSTALVLCEEARAHYRAAQFSLSAQKYEQACEIFKKEEDWGAFYNFQIGVIDSYFRLGDAQKVINMISVERENCASKLGATHGLVGDYYFLEIKIDDRFGDGNRVPELTQKALDILIPTNGGKIGSCYNSLGVYWLEKQDYDQALDNLNRAIQFKIKKFGADSGTVGVSYNNIGNVYQNLGDYLKAIEFFQKSLDIKIKRYGKIHPRVSNTYFNIGSTYSEAGNLDQAILYYKKAIAIDLQSEDDPNRKLAFRYTSLSKAFLYQKRFDLALKYGHLAIDYYAKTDLNPKFSAAAFQNLGNVYGTKKEYTRAFSFYQKALAVLSSKKLSESSLVNPEIEDRFANERLYKVLDKKLQTLEEWNKELPDIAKLKAALNTAEALIQTISLIQQDIESENSKYLFLKDSRLVFEKALSFCLELFERTGDPVFKEKAFEIYEQSKAFLLRNTLQNERAKNLAEVPDSIRQNITSLKEERNDLVFQIERSDDNATKRDLEKSLFDKTRQHQLLVSELEQQFPKYYQTKNELAVLSLSTIQDFIRKKDENIIAWFTGAEQLFFFQVSASSIDFKRMDKDSSFEKSIISFTNLLNNNNLASEKGNSKSLYLDFIDQSKTIYNQLFPTDFSIPKTVILIPDGVLNLIPFEILLADDSGNTAAIDYSSLPYLLKKASVRYAYSPSLLLNPPQPQRSSKNEILAFAPTYSGMSNSLSEARAGFTPLIFAKEEIKNINSIFTVEKRIGALATKENFKSTASEYRFLHLAMHAYTDDQSPSLSGLAFSEIGKEEESTLFAYEIANMQLQADLVVLSACNTGTGKMVSGEGPISLARSFRQAGCSNVVMSLWSADDETTSILMASFYENLKAGKGKAEALQLAKLAYLNQSRKIFPHYWAAFVLTGDNDPVDLKGLFNLLFGSLGLVLLLFIAFLIWRTKT